MSDNPTTAPSLPAEDDFTHYFNATQRLSAENADLRFKIKDLVSDNGRILCDIGRRDAEISKLRAQLAAGQQRVAELEQQLDGSAESIVNEAGKVGQLMNAAAKSATVSVWEQAIVELRLTPIMSDDIVEVPQGGTLAEYRLPFTAAGFKELAIKKLEAARDAQHVASEPKHE